MRYLLTKIFLVLILTFSSALIAQTVNRPTEIDRVTLITQQIKLLQSRLTQAETELTQLQTQHDARLTELAIEKTSKSMLDKGQMDATLAKTNLDSISIEYNDAQQNISWLEKNIQEIENQLNVLNMFGLKIAPNERDTILEYNQNLEYQKKLLQVEKTRIKYLSDLQKVTQNVWQMRVDNLNRLRSLLRSRRLSIVKQQQVHEELAFQEQQNHWLNQLTSLQTQLAKTDPVKAKVKYAELERNIFYANENANYAYIQSLMARYKDQIRQMNVAAQKSNSISVLNEIRDQAQVFGKQIVKLSAVLKERLVVVQNSIAYLNNKDRSKNSYFKNLLELQKQYQSTDEILVKLALDLTKLRETLNQALQNELSARQGFPAFSVKTLIDLGKEILLVPALTFQIAITLSNHFVEAFQGLTLLSWIIFIAIEAAVLFAFNFLHYLLTILTNNSAYQEQFTFRWVMLEWLRRNFLDVVFVGNLIGIMLFFEVPIQHLNAIFSMMLVWLVFKGLITLSRLCLIENTHDTAGKDVKLYHRLKWIILVGGFITALTVFVHQLPLIYELKTLCDRLFLLFLMIISLLLLRSWDVVPNLILSAMETKHPYLRKSICLLGILIPLLMFANAFVGLLGYVNLIMTIARYEGIFLLVLFGYLVLRGILSDVMEQLSRLMIQYVNNGWLWTEAFLKPLDKVLRITLFLMAGGLLFLLYGWDQQSPIVERLTRLLHYELASLLNTTITPIRIIELFIVISIFYWSAKWTREFVYRLLLSRTQDMGIRNSIAILSQYSVIVIGGLFCLQVLGIDLRAIAVVFSVFAFGIGWGLRDLANNFACGFLILLERPLRVGDIVSINDIEGEVIHIGSRAVTVRTWDHMDLVVPNTEIFNKSFTNWTAKDNIVRSVMHIKISRYDNPHEIKVIIQNVLADHKEILKDPVPDVYLKELTDHFMDFEIRYYVNIRQVKSRTFVISSVLMQIWDVFAKMGIQPPHPQQEIILRNERPKIQFHEARADKDIL